jgi:hypothetical protein
MSFIVILLAAATGMMFIILACLELRIARISENYNYYSVTSICAPWHASWNVPWNYATGVAVLLQSTVQQTNLQYRIQRILIPSGMGIFLHRPNRSFMQMKTDPVNSILSARLMETELINPHPLVRLMETDHPNPICKTCDVQERHF